jgi:hexosaminidase
MKERIKSQAIRPSPLRRGVGGEVISPKGPDIYREKGWLKAGVVVMIYLLSIQVIAQVDLIPKPLIRTFDETVTIPDSIEIVTTKYSTEAELLIAYFGEFSINTTIVDKRNSVFYVFLEEKEDYWFSPEGYELTIAPKGMVVQAASAKGIISAIQTIRQLFFISNRDSAGAFLIPSSKITDSPAFSHRGLLLDCSRHFFSVETVKKYIDLLAFYKMNVLHWHLTEDQGWRIQIDKYPKLTEVGAWRTEKDGSRYGGFYTKEEIREVVAYASARGVTVIPEIEMPGHSQAAIASYPRLSCTGEQVDVANDWGVFKEIYCAGNDSVFAFLEDVLAEVMELFPSKYIHIGGDEAPKFRWEHCAKCQRRMAEEGLKDEHELQSYFITRIEKFLNDNGRQLIGWDEILEGGLSPNATVQSWRGMEHGKHAAKMRHNVVMSPTSHCYLDYGLDAIDLERVYSFNPIPEGLEAEFEQYILGGEVNMWTEHVLNDSVLDSRVFPRLIAMAEVLWSGPGGDFEDFYNRLQSHYSLLDKMGVQYGLEAEPVHVSTLLKNGKTFVNIEPGLPDLTIEYSPGDDLAHAYEGPFELDRSMNLEVMTYKNGELYGQPYKTELNHHLALGKTDSISAFSPYYTAGGTNGLTDGLTGSLNFRDGRWMGFSGEDVYIEIDLGKEQNLTAVSMNCYEYPNAWIMLPESVGLEVSGDGKKWEHLSGVILQSDPQKDPSRKRIIEHKIPINRQEKFRYIRIIALNYGKLPEWHDAAGSDAWIFMDEIIVR